MARHAGALAAVIVVLSSFSGCMLAKADVLNRAGDLYQEGRYRQAAAEYRRAIAIDASWAPPWLGLGNALRMLDDRPGALASYRRAIALSPKYTEARVALADLLLGERRWSESERELRLAVERLPDDCRLHAMLGYALFNEQRERDALVAFQTSVDLCADCMTQRESTAYETAKRQVEFQR